MPDKISNSTVASQEPSELDKIYAKIAEREKDVLTAVRGVKPPQYTGIERARDIISSDVLLPLADGRKDSLKEYKRRGIAAELFSDPIGDLARIEGTLKALLFTTGDFYLGAIASAYYRLTGSIYLIPDQLLPKLRIYKDTSSKEYGSLTANSRECSITLNATTPDMLVTIQHELTHLQQAIPDALKDVNRLPIGMVAGAMVYFPKTEQCPNCGEIVADSVDEVMFLIGKIERTLGADGEKLVAGVLGVGPNEDVLTELYSRLAQPKEVAKLNASLLPDSIKTELSLLAKEVQDLEDRLYFEHPDEEEAFSRQSVKEGNILLSAEAGENKGILQMPLEEKARREFIKQLRESAARRKEDILRNGLPLGLTAAGNIPDFLAFGMALCDFGKGAAKNGLLFMGGEYASEAIMSAIKGDWSRFKGLSAIQVMKDFGGLAAGSTIGQAIHAGTFNAIPALERIPFLKSLSGRAVPLFAAIMLLKAVRNEKVSPDELALEAANIGIAAGVVELIGGIRMIKNAAQALKVLKGGGLIGAGIAITANFLIIKALGEFENFMVKDVPLRNARDTLASLICANNNMLVKMQRGEFVDASEFGRVQMEFTKWSAYLKEASAKETTLGSLPVDIPVAENGQDPLADYRDRETVEIKAPLCGRNMLHDMDCSFEVTRRPMQEHVSGVLDKNWNGLSAQLDGYIARSNSAVAGLLS